MSDIESKLNAAIFITGGPIDLAEGWAKIPFTGERAHFWVDDKIDAIGPRGRTKFYTSLCGRDATTDPKLPALDPGNWPKCKRCERAKRKAK